MFAHLLGLTLLLSSALVNAQATIDSPPIPGDINKWERVDWSDCVTTTDVRFQSTLFMKQVPTINPKVAKLSMSISVFSADGKKFMESHTDYRSRPAQIVTYVLDDGVWRRYESNETNPLPPTLEGIVGTATAKVLKTPAGKNMKDVSCKDKPRS